MEFEEKTSKLLESYGKNEFSSESGLSDSDFITAVHGMVQKRRKRHAIQSTVSSIAFAIIFAVVTWHGIPGIKFGADNSLDSTGFIQFLMSDYLSLEDQLAYNEIDLDSMTLAFLDDDLVGMYQMMETEEVSEPIELMYEFDEEQLETTYQRLKEISIL